jgi:hypothetical protein
MASRLELRQLRDVPPFLTAALRIRRQMLGSPGALGVSLIARPLHRTFWTLSAWQDQAALLAAVGREPQAAHEALPAADGRLGLHHLGGAARRPAYRVGRCAAPAGNPDTIHRHR